MWRRWCKHCQKISKVLYVVVDTQRMWTMAVVYCTYCQQPYDNLGVTCEHCGLGEELDTLGLVRGIPERYWLYAKARGVYG